ncbi:ABC transporter permease subunit [Candidatus Kaiserbacteria bacterium]|nr:ABC transporter permease subunit [Candidatus Kaiserbacteria bacterium]
MKHPRHRAHHMFLTYPVSVRERLYSLLIGPLLVAAAIYLVVSLFQTEVAESGVATWHVLVEASFATLARITVAYILAVVVGIPLAILATHNRLLEKILLPVFDVLESVPILAFFPVVVVMFVRWDFMEGAAVSILFLSMLWNIVFTLVGGLKIIPQDIVNAARIFGLSGFAYVRRVLIPAVFPQLVIGSVLAVAQGWNLIIIAEALHTYIPHGNPSQDLFGIGSILVSAAANAHNTVFAEALVIMVLMIAVLNLFVWQRLITYSQRFRFD